ncbi:hypothetical protein Bhyg_16110, partial [Pseudolycoriella hygida]
MVTMHCTNAIASDPWTHFQPKYAISGHNTPKTTRNIVPTEIRQVAYLNSN